MATNNHADLRAAIHAAAMKDLVVIYNQVLADFAVAICAVGESGDAAAIAALKKAVQADFECRIETKLIAMREQIGRYWERDPHFHDPKSMRTQ
jgi:hypothetical protein